jgi:hypothetical protein
MTLTQKRFLLFLCITLIVFVSINYYVHFLLSKCEVGSIAKVNAVMAHQIEAKAVVWGSSTALVHFNPEIIEKQLQMSCVNLGMNGVPFQQYAGLLEEYIEYAKTTKVLIVSVDVTGFKSRPSLYLGYNWVHQINNDHIYESIKSIDPDLAFKSRYIPLYYLTTYDRRFLTRCFSWVYSSSAYEKELDSKGFHPENLEWQNKNQEEIINAENGTSYQLEIDKQIFSKFAEVMKFAEQKNIKVAIVIPPCYSTFQKRISNRNEFESLLTSLTSSKVRVFNYLDSQIGSNQNYFYNNLHLNTSGADAFSSLVSQDLQEWLIQSKN